MKKLSFSLMLLFVLCGCTGYREIDSLSVLSALGIDKTTEGLILTGEVVVPKQGTADLSAYFINMEGNNFYDALSNGIGNVPENLYLSHIDSIIIDENYAAYGISSLLNDFARDNGVRLSSNVFIAKDASSEEILKNRADDTVSGVEISNKLERAKSVSSTINTEIYKLISNDGTGVLPAIRLSDENGKTSYEIYGGAILQNGVLIDFLTPKQCLILNILQNNVLSGIFEDDGGNIFRIEKSTSKISPMTENYSSYTITAELSLELMHTNTEGNLSPHMCEILEENAKLYMLTEINELLIFLKSTNADVLGLERFSENKGIPEFHECNFTIHVDTKITQSGLLMTGDD